MSSMVVDAFVGVLVEQRLEDARAFVAVLGEVVALAHVVGALTAGERRLIEGDVADEVEGVESCLTYVLGERLEEDALLVELVDDRLLAVGWPPALQEVVERWRTPRGRAARVVAQRLGDELAVRAVVLDALGDDADRHVRRRRTCAAGPRPASSSGVAVAARPSGVRGGHPSIGVSAVVGVDPSSGGTIGSSLAGLVDLHRVAVEVGVGEQLGRLAEVEDGEAELAVSSLMRVPRPMICLNSVIDWMRWSSTISLQVWASTPVVISSDVVAITG